MGPELGWMQWLIWGTGTLVFGAIIVGVFIAAWRAGKRPPEQLSAARHVAREQALPDSVQAELAALNQRKDNGQLSEMEYEQLRAKGHADLGQSGAHIGGTGPDIGCFLCRHGASRYGRIQPARHPAHIRHQKFKRRTFDDFFG